MLARSNGLGYTVWIYPVWEVENLGERSIPKVSEV